MDPADCILLVPGRVLFGASARLATGLSGSPCSICRPLGGCCGESMDRVSPEESGRK